ncbi:hypothetical protein Anapl_14633 [Anas platyrhynchos]|uniref:Uncharacterized protein n=1 Tax=Anas platyrhynchos TaxID=8839 RepID=R0JNG2_ANAPL|nr:hypothetical protein Anapl_14633 [Anas platyrhynchos]
MGRLRDATTQLLGCQQGAVGRQWVHPEELHQHRCQQDTMKCKALCWAQNGGHCVGVRRGSRAMAAPELGDGSVHMSVSQGYLSLPVFSQVLIKKMLYMFELFKMCLPALLDKQPSFSCFGNFKVKAKYSRHLYPFCKEDVIAYEQYRSKKTLFRQSSITTKLLSCQKAAATGIQLTAVATSSFSAVLKDLSLQGQVLPKTAEVP